MAEQLPDPEDPELDKIVYALALEASADGKSASIPRIVERLRPTKTALGFRKPEILWSLFRLWRAGKIHLLALVTPDPKDLKDKLYMPTKVKGRWIGEFAATGFAGRKEQLVPARPPRPPLPMKNWPKRPEQYIKQGCPFTVAYGVGVDSTAMLVGFWKRGMRPDLILFADVGSEKPETYRYLTEVMDPWLRKVGFPPVTVVRYEMTEAGLSRRGSRGLESEGYSSLEMNCINNHTLPSLAFGFRSHSCSTKWKVRPQLDFVEQQVFPSILRHNLDNRGNEIPIVRAIGFDASLGDRGRRNRVRDDILYQHWYPLQEWDGGWNRIRCIEEIEKAGLEAPVKSACYFCPASQPQEMEWMARVHPDLVERIQAIEDAAQPYLKKGLHQGLWFEGGKVSSQMREHLPVLKNVGDYFFPTGRPTAAQLDKFIQYFYFDGWQVPTEVKWRGKRPLGAKLPGRMSDFIKAYLRLCEKYPDHPRVMGWKIGTKPRGEAAEYPNINREICDVDFGDPSDLPDDDDEDAA